MAHVRLASGTERGKKYKPPAVCSREVSGPSDARAFYVRTAPLPLFSLLARDAENYGYAVDISDGTTLNGRLYEATGGDFYHPAPSATALRNWGTLEARFGDCDEGRFTLIGSDGSRSSIVVKLAGVVGAECR